MTCRWESGFFERFVLMQMIQCHYLCMIKVHMEGQATDGPYGSVSTDRWMWCYLRAGV